MQAPFDNIVQHLFHQPSLQSVTVDELERMAIQHPYFAPAHFLLLKKMQDITHPAFNAQLHKTTLYFNNPLWLQFLLHPEAVHGFEVSPHPPFIEEEAAASESASESEEKHTETFAAAPAEKGYAYVNGVSATAGLQQVPDPENGIAAHTATVPPTGIMDVITEVFTETHEAPESALDETPRAAVADHFTANLQEEMPVPEQATIDQHHPEEAFTDHPVTDTDGAESSPMAAETTEWIAASPNDTAISEAVEQPNASTAKLVFPENTHTPVTNNGMETTTADQAATAVVNQEQPPVDTDAAAEADATEFVNETPQQETNAPLLKTIIETPAALGDTLFEPYHTVDYFASQGIRLSKAEAEPKDKLGRQLKSFTEWLKTMKKLPQVSIDKLLSENEESKVVADAIHSIENKEVITEAMAEVFEKQGMNEKAVEVYHKLSLLNPAKSAYFAAKIATLKH